MDYGLNKAPASTHLDIANREDEMDRTDNTAMKHDYQTDAGPNGQFSPEEKKKEKFAAQMSDSIQDMAEAPHIVDEYIDDFQLEEDKVDED